MTYAIICQKYKGDDWYELSEYARLKDDLSRIRQVFGDLETARLGRLRLIRRDETGATENNIIGERGAAKIPPSDDEVHW